MIIAPSPTLARLGFKWRRLRRNLEPGRKGICLDVGSGAAPWPRADVLLEARPTQTAQESALLLDRPLVVGSIEALPFRDHAFSYVNASHVLEHVPRPDRALSELMRVAPRGYLEVPTRLHERLWPRADHLWTVELEQGRLSFRPLPETDSELGNWFSASLDADKRLRSFYWSRYFQDFVHCLSWQGRIDCRLVGPHPQAEAPPTLDTEQLERRLQDARRRGSGSRARAKRLLGRLLGASAVSLPPLLACPDCLAELAEQDRELLCSGCGRNYPVVAGVPILYPEAPRRPAATSPTGDP